ncbi:hypothetical protein F5878DRAFT_675205 [Lentinula raphanica]|uniref:Uncharacterized protein n=1 Tax=Lentinula raphanica TaxID=153919 RepID=A0AA38U2Z4_9AGAR|nr:hypothetical protein F5878DRAFT_675205 [Lentinula raphanica]
MTYSCGIPYKIGERCIGSPIYDVDYNRLWLALIEASLYSTDSHLLKTMQTLILAAKEYGDTPPGSVIGAFRQHSGIASKEENHSGMAKVDGTIFVNCEGYRDVDGLYGIDLRLGGMMRGRMKIEICWCNE